MMSDFDPTTNLLQYLFLNECEKTSMRNWPWGWEFYSFRQGGWKRLDQAAWCEDVVYRGKPKPVVTSEWFNVYPQGPVPHAHSTRKKADEAVSFGCRIAVLRIDTCNGVSTADFEELCND